MSVYAARPIKTKRPSKTGRVRSTNAEMESLFSSIYELLIDYNPMTCRQVFYQLESKGLIEKVEREVTRVQRAIATMRENDMLPWEWITDSTRFRRQAQTYDSLRDALADAARSYRRSMWAQSDCVIEIWCEKDTLTGVVADTCYANDVALMISRGFASKTYIYESAMAIRKREKSTVIYYIGDWDPSGLLIPKSIESGLRKYSKRDFVFERIAVTPEQIKTLNLPTRPTKESNHTCGFVGGSVEAEAIPPATLCQILEDAINRHIDVEMWNRTLEIENAERETMATIAAKFGGAA